MKRLLRTSRPKRRVGVQQYLKKVPERHVYVAWDPVIRQRVVVKRYGNVADARHERNVMRAYPGSRHLVRYYRFVAGRSYGSIIMEWVRGLTLAQLIARDGPLAEGTVRALALDMLAGLRVLHGAGFLHGDMHSPNVIVTNRSLARTKLIDFQHAVPLRRDGTARARRTVSARPLKFGPECSTGVIDRAFDTYGVGFMCASMLLGTEPVTRQQLHTPRLGASYLWPVIERALHPKPSARYQTTDAMHAALQSIR